MKKVVYIILFAMCFSFKAFSQAAVDFTATDCNSTSHNLFQELNAGKVIVLVWVMPCANCVGPSLTANNVVKSYLTSNPNTVRLYLVDDYANTNCASLNSWKSSNNLSEALTFSDAKIKMSDYGSAGMPKIVVLGGWNHTIFLNVNNSVTSSALQDAIGSAITATGVDEKNTTVSQLIVYPNPASKGAEVKFNLSKPTDLTLDLYDMQGKKVLSILSGKLSEGENKIPIDCSGIAPGTYLIRLSGENKSKYVTLVITQ